MHKVDTTNAILAEADATLRSLLQEIGGGKSVLEQFSGATLTKDHVEEEAQKITNIVDPPKIKQAATEMLPLVRNSNNVPKKGSLPKDCEPAQAYQALFIELLEALEQLVS